MNLALEGLESVDSGSNYKFANKMERNKNPRSLFDLSHLNTLTIPNAGMLVPIALWETVPNDDFDINVDCLLRVMPQVVPLYSRQRLYIYGFYSRYSDLWVNWQIFKDKGYSGTDNRTIPTIHYQTSSSSNNFIYTSASPEIRPNTLFDYLGLPIGASSVDLFNRANNNPTAKISALPFMMYLRIYRDYFMNKNHWITDRVMLPDDDSRFRLDDNGNLLSAKDLSKSFLFSNETTQPYDLTISGNTYKFAGAMHDYPDDYFTSALPFPQRGTATPLNNNVSITDIANKLGIHNNTPAQETTWTQNANYVVGSYTHNSNTEVLSAGTMSGSTLVLSGNGNNAFKDALANSLSIYALQNSGYISLNITLNDLRKMAVEQQELEQLARTDGSYFQFGLSFFGEPSKAAYDYKPTYIGGTYKNIAFTEVLSTATTDYTDSGSTVQNPTGSMYGHGITGISQGRIGHIHCDDYGMIMLIACIMPDVYYSQGLDRIFTDQIEAEKFMPERVLLGMQPILNKEIYYAGNNGSSSGDDNYLWAYQNPYDWLRYIPNHIHGKIADPNSKSFYPYTQARHFTQLPNWGRSFSSTADVRKDYLVSSTEDAYSAQFKMNIRAVRPLPYKALPGKLVHF